MSAFSALTLNVWFDIAYFLPRFLAQLELMRDSDADVIALQEVTQRWVDAYAAAAASTPWLSVYTFSGAVFSASSYCTAALVKSKHIPSFLRVPFPSDMGRDLLLCTLARANTRVGVVHLESLNNADLRAAQLEVCAAQLGGGASTHLLLCGDFNFCSRWSYNDMKRSLAADAAAAAAAADAAASSGGTPTGGASAGAFEDPPPFRLRLPPGVLRALGVSTAAAAKAQEDKAAASPLPRQPLENEALARVLPAFVDVWVAAHGPLAPGYTFDSSVNGMLSHAEQMRYDRILWRASASASHPHLWRLARVSLVGTQELPPRLLRECGVIEPAAAAAAAGVDSGYDSPPPRRRPRVWCSDHFGVLAVWENEILG